VLGVSISIELTFRWPMGHRILGLEGAGAKCRNIHGHNWEAVVSLPNDDGTLEFGAVKAEVGDWIESNWDHGFMAEYSDEFLNYLHDQHLKYYSLNVSPTTENIAVELAVMVDKLIGVKPRSVHVIEGYRNAATWKDDCAWP
jgi:6-pyruvoyltetrahydropterin/6-carboxytetrahydropterin synthase